MFNFFKSNSSEKSQDVVVEYEIKHYSFSDNNSVFNILLLYKDEEGKTRKYSEKLYGFLEEVSFIEFQEGVKPKVIFEKDSEGEKTLLKIILPDV